MKFFVNRKLCTYSRKEKSTQLLILHAKGGWCGGYTLPFIGEIPPDITKWIDKAQTIIGTKSEIVDGKRGVEKRTGQNFMLHGNGDYNRCKGPQI